GMVAKQAESRYEPGQRGGTWLKIKTTQEQEFVVCGHLPGEGYRAASFGALVLGYYAERGLTFAGAVGSGFRDADLAWWLKQLKPMETVDCPFADGVPREVANPTWVAPKMVVRVKFSNWTREGNLRAPVYLGLRDDIPAKTVVRERPVPAPTVSAATTAAGDPDEVAEVLRQLEGERDRITIEVRAHRLALTNLNKPYWPALGKRASITKRDFIRYLALVSPFMLPHLRDRPMNLTRYPSGFDGPAFYQKHWTAERPPFVETVRLFSGHNEADQEYAMVQNLPTLLWMGQLATLELHPWLSRVTGAPEALDLPTVFTGSDAAIEASTLNYPDFLIFDLDPYIYSGKEAPKQEPELNRTAFEQVRAVAFKLREVLEAVALRPFLKTSGKTGLHLYVPVVRNYDYGYIRKACATIGRFLAAAMPGVITMDWTVERRTGRIFFDHNQNSRGKTLVGPYSLRPSLQVTVSTPITWEELATVYPTDFTIATVPA
ncbi:MAG: ATP-dependent DNA ligase, partial [Chloroflexota bacterium]